MHRAAVELREGGAQASLLHIAQRYRRGDDGDHALPALGGELGQGLQSRLQATSTRRGHKTRHQTLGGRLGPAAEKAAQQLALGRGGGGAVGQRGAQPGVGGDDPAEPEQLVLDVVERARLLGGGEVGGVRQLLQRVHQVAGLRPAGAHHAGQQVGGRTADLSAEQALGQVGLGLAGLRRVGEDPTQRHLAVEQRGDGGQLVGELGRVDGRRVRQRVETLTCGCQGLAARSVHRPASAFSSSSSRKRSMTRLCRAWSSRDSPTSLPARSVASLPTSWRSADAAALRSASIWA